MPDVGAIDKETVLSFLGYGNPRAEAVFIGMEEGLTLPPSIRDQLVRRSTFAPIVDLHEALAGQPDKYLSGGEPPIQPTWNTIIRVLLAIEGGLTSSIAEIRRYQCNRLGRARERGAMLELMPLPAHDAGAWPYADFFDEFPTRRSYLESMLEARIGRFREHLAYGPKLVVAYGSSFWPHYKRIFSEATAWQKSGQFERCRLDSTHVILTPHFRSRQMNGQRGALIDLAREPARAHELPA